MSGYVFCVNGVNYHINKEHLVPFMTGGQYAYWEMLTYGQQDDVMEDFECAYPKVNAADNTFCYTESPCKKDIDKALKDYVKHLSKTFLSGDSKRYQRSITARQQRIAEVHIESENKLEKLKKRLTKTTNKATEKNEKKKAKIEEQIDILDLEIEQLNQKVKHILKVQEDKVKSTIESDLQAFEERKRLRQEALDRQNENELKQIHIKHTNLQDEMNKRILFGDDNATSKLQLKKEKLEVELEKYSNDDDINMTSNPEYEQIMEERNEQIETYKQQIASLKNGDSLYLDH